MLQARPNIADSILQLQTEIAEYERRDTIVVKRFCCHYGVAC